MSDVFTRNCMISGLLQTAGVSAGRIDSTAADGSSVIHLTDPETTSISTVERLVNEVLKPAGFSVWSYAGTRDGSHAVGGGAFIVGRLADPRIAG